RVSFHTCPAQPFLTSWRASKSTRLTRFCHERPNLACTSARPAPSNPLGPTTPRGSPAAPGHEEVAMFALHSVRPRTALIAGLAALALLGGCAASTELSDMWRDPDFQGPPLRNVVVIAMRRNSVQ